MNKGFSVLVLAAGKGTRFKSDAIKVLHHLMGRTMLQLVVDTIRGLAPNEIFVVVGYQKDDIIKQPFARDLRFVTQGSQLGTAHAVLAAEPELRKSQDKDILVINGDLPLLKTETLKPFLKHHQATENSLTFMTTDLENPAGFGRVFLEGRSLKIIEERDATPLQRRIKEVNVGIYLFRIKDLVQALPKVTNANKKGEFYLTDLIAILGNQGKTVGTYKTFRNEEIVGVNDRYELARATESLRLRKIMTLMKSGVTVYDPSSTWIDLDVKIGRDTTVYPSVIIEGNSVIGSHCTLYPHVHILNSRLGKGVTILSSTMIEHSRIEEKAQVGPFTHLRPKTIIKKGAKVGNFVEMKNTVFGRNSKAGHLSYLGDAEVADEVNIGAGTITCNYDGVMKRKTRIESGAFIGSGTELVAPVTVGKNAYVGAGSTITKDVSPESLAVSRSRQFEKKGWARRKRKK
ncbi:MAG: bifunctional UDP-N-acetylglucosamine diphosphorylase/glucosamine-1-phosphate N-acetyltransferase GlmU [Candidatus Aminicenantes bacterium]|nr:bifunctional UDP-N-acetylglucosamine diphosphorylase/glucosamine-1-phosphate N-acetyltransferase GlmU [Candidatus Aminicenantes bacterium]